MSAQTRRGWLRVLGWLGAAVLRGLGASWRISQDGPDPFEAGAEPVIGVAWHENALVLAHQFRDRGISIAVSRSRDGDWISALLRPLGYGELVRGSSSRSGATALLGLVRQLRAGTTVSILADGPRGPARVSKPGPIALGRLSGIVLSPMACRARPAIRFGSWDRTVLPLPFARVQLSWGAPIEVPADADAACQEALREQLERALVALAERD